MKSPYHEGELAVHAKVGVESEALRIGKSIHATIPSVARDFLSRQPMAIVASVGSGGGVWTSLLTGEEGFLRVADDQTLQVLALPTTQDQLFENLISNEAIGLLVIDLATRKRMRLNGKAEFGDGGLSIRVQQVYANCPKYIQLRQLTRRVTPPDATYRVSHNTELAHEQSDWIAASDTFFISSYHANGGADASHRGGQPGFVRVLDSTTLEFPDYIGNNMFNTLGNIWANPNVSLLFINFESGATLQLRGNAVLNWNHINSASADGQRFVQVTIHQVVETTIATALRWSFVEYSPFNPK